MAWVLRWVKTGVEGEAPCADIMEIRKPDDLVDVANLGLTLAEAKRLLAGVQREIVAAQAGIHAVRRPDCSCCGGVCRVKDHRDHAVATLFGEVTVRLPRFRCAVCDGIEAGLAWPLHCRSTPGLDRLQAHLSAVMSDRTAADVVGQMFSVDAGTRHETLRRPTLKVGEALGDDVAPWPDTAASAIVVTLDATFIRRCADGERHLEVRVGNGETASAGRQVFGAVAKAGTDIRELIRCNLDAVGRTENTALTAFTDGLSADDPARGAAEAVIIEEVERLHWRIWNGKAKDAQVSIDRSRAVMHHFQGEPDQRRSTAPARKLWTALLGSAFGQKFQPANNPYPTIAIAARHPISRRYPQEAATQSLARGHTESTKTVGACPGTVE